MCGKSDKSLAQLPCKHSYCVTCLNKCPVKAVKEQAKSNRSTKGTCPFQKLSISLSANLLKLVLICCIWNKLVKD